MKRFSVLVLGLRVALLLLSLVLSAELVVHFLVECFPHLYFDDRLAWTLDDSDNDEHLHNDLHDHTPDHHHYHHHHHQQHNHHHHHNHHNVMDSDRSLSSSWFFRAQQSQDNENEVIHPCDTADATDEDRASVQRALDFVKRRKQAMTHNYLLFTPLSKDVNPAKEILDWSKEWKTEKENTNAAILSATVREIPVCLHVPWNFFTVFARHLTNRRLQDTLDRVNRAFSAQSCCDASKHAWCRAKSRAQQCSLETGLRLVWAEAPSWRLRLWSWWWPFQKTHTHHSVHTTSTHADSTTQRFIRPACVLRPYSLFTTRIQRGTWTERRLKLSRIGNATVLNVYVAVPKRGRLGGSNLGYATFPWKYADDPQDDGVVVHPGSLVRGRLLRFNEGDTLAHEIGHWLGAFHPFQSGCSPGDGVSDTPAGREPVYGCSIEADSCPNQQGNDPVHNFMSYSDDACIYEWTEGQTGVMQANYDAYRSNRSSNSINAPIVLEDGVDSGPHSIADSQTLTMTWNVSAVDRKNNATLLCRARADHGRFVLLTYWSRVFDECITGASELDPTYCLTTQPSANDVLNLLFVARRTVVSLWVNCSTVQLPPETPQVLENNVTLTNISVGAGQFAEYVLLTMDDDDDQHANASSSLATVQCEFWAESGSFTVFGSSSNDLAAASCIESSPSLSEDESLTSCRIRYSLRNEFHFWILATNDADVDQLSLTCVATVASLEYLENGIVAGNQSLAVAGEEQFYALPIRNTTHAVVTCETVGSDEYDVDLYLYWTDHTSSSCSSTTPRSNESCSIGIVNSEDEDDEDTLHYAIVRTVGFSAVPSFNLTCTITSAIALIDGITSAPYSVETRRFVFFSFITNVRATVTCRTTADNGDLELLLNTNGIMGPYACGSRSSGSVEECSIGPLVGTVFVFAYGDEAVSNFTVMCQSEPVE